jgi:hypothetical protein
VSEVCSMRGGNEIAYRILFEMPQMKAPFRISR